MPYGKEESLSWALPKLLNHNITTRKKKKKKDVDLSHCFGVICWARLGNNHNNKLRETSAPYAEQAREGWNHRPWPLDPSGARSFGLYSVIEEYAPQGAKPEPGSWSQWQGWRSTTGKGSKGNKTAGGPCLGLWLRESRISEAKRKKKIYTTQILNKRWLMGW